jgi:PIN domain nuclease of toxin-antitoxin system
VKALLDTHTFLWWNMDNPQLSSQVREIISNGSNEIYLSAASAWEIAIKAAHGRLTLPLPPLDYVPDRMRIHRFQPLSVQISHALLVSDLPPHHRDPFDRLLIAQSMLESIPILTQDEEITRYHIETIW